jgi:energy-coupling factor transporter ATP-binding protein EcfA2
MTSAIRTEDLLRRLSRGKQMKAALASSLAYRPRLVLLDEPSPVSTLRCGTN